MKTDKNGCSTCKKGQENYEYFYNSALKKEMIQYDYRHTDGGLFSTCKATLDECRDARDKWLKENNKEE